MSKSYYYKFEDLNAEQIQDTRYKIQETLFYVGLYTETLAQ